MQCLFKMCVCVKRSERTNKNWNGGHIWSAGHTLDTPKMPYLILFVYLLYKLSYLNSTSSLAMDHLQLKLVHGVWYKKIIVVVYSLQKMFWSQIYCVASVNST